MTEPDLNSTAPPTAPATPVIPVLPALPLEPWEETRATLHLYAQMVGKIRLASTPPRNHWWHTTLAVTARGLSTGRMRHDAIDFQIEFDFIEHALEIRLCTGPSERIDLTLGRSVRDFYLELVARLEKLGLRVPIRASAYGMPYSTARFVDETRYASYDAEAVSRFWDVLRWVDTVFAEYGAHYRGKQSPSQLFWHSFDLAITRFSGRLAPPRPEADRVTQVAYDEEVISVGFWPGDPTVRAATFYAYAAPEPAGLAEVRLQPADAHWIESGGSHTAHLAYEAVRTAPDPRAALLTFLDGFYEAAARAAGWNTQRLANPWVG